jgi:hypothetical protein
VLEAEEISEGTADQRICLRLAAVNLRRSLSGEPDYARHAIND